TRRRRREERRSRGLSRQLRGVCGENGTRSPRHPQLGRNGVRRHFRAGRTLRQISEENGQGAPDWYGRQPAAAEMTPVPILRYAMSDEQEEDFAALFEASQKARPVGKGQAVEGTIVQIGAEVAL